MVNMNFLKYTTVSLFAFSVSVYGAVLPSGGSVEVRPLSYNYTVVQDYEHSVLEASHAKDGSIKEDQVITHNSQFSAAGFFSFNASGSAQATAKRNDNYKDYKENHKHTATTYNDTIMVEKVMYSDKMTSVIETALNDAGVPMSKTGEYVLTGSIKSMRTSKPRLVPDGSNVRYAITATSTIHIQIAHKKSGKVAFTKTFTGTGQQTFDINDPVPVDDTISMSVDDLTATMVEALTGKKRSTEVNYQDSPGKRLVD